MRLTELNGFTFPIPFKLVFKHVSASRRYAENFVVCVATREGVSGFGEGCPRPYVTGEDVESCFGFLSEHQSSLLNSVEDVETLRQWMVVHRIEIDKNPAAFCAIEMAILDALGREESSNIESLLDISPERGIVRYSAVLGDAPLAAYWWVLRRYVENGFTDFKVKLSGNIRRDERKLQLLSARGATRQHIRLDANNLWAKSDECIDYLSSLSQVFWAIEEPLQPRDLSGMQTIETALKVRLILDESCTRVEDLEDVCGNSWVLNLRVSKAGGILRAIDLAGAAHSKDIGVILGTHVGETSLLTRGTLVVLQFLRNRQIACEGAFGRHLLTSDLSNEVIEFDTNAAINLQKLKLLRTPGNGLTIDRNRLQSR